MREDEDAVYSRELLNLNIYQSLVLSTLAVVASLPTSTLGHNHHDDYDCKDESEPKVL